MSRHELYPDRQHRFRFNPGAKTQRRRQSLLVLSPRLVAELDTMYRSERDLRPVALPVIGQAGAGVLPVHSTRPR